MKRLTMAFMVLMLTTVTITAFGQQKPATIQPAGQDDDEKGAGNPGQPGRNGPLSEKNREEIRNKIEAVRIWRLTDALKLDAGTSARVSSLLSSLDQQRRDLQREQIKTMRILRVVIKTPKPDESRLKTALETLEKNHHAMQQLGNNETNGLKNILTIEQQARYVVFQQEFMHEMRGMIRGAHGNQMHEGMPGRLPEH